MSKFGSLLGDVAFTLNSNASAVAIQTIPLDRIKSDPNNPRRKFDQAQLEELAESIKNRGILQPITVRPLEGGVSFMVRYGDRRFRAAALAGLTEIAAIVTNSKADENDILDQVVENDQREDLSAAEMATAVANALAEGMKAVDIAKRLGRPKSVVAEYAAVQEMPPFLQELAEAVPIGTVYPLFLAWRTNPEPVEAFVTEKGGRAITRAEAREFSRAASGKSAPAKEADDGSEPPLPLAGGAESSAGRTIGDDVSGSETPAPVQPAPNPPAEKDTENSPPVQREVAPAAPIDVDKAPADAAPKPDAKGVSASPKARVQPVATEASIAVVIDGRRARLVLPATVDVVFEDDGSTASVDRASVSAAEE